MEQILSIMLRVIFIGVAIFFTGMMAMTGLFALITPWPIGRVVFALYAVLLAFVAYGTLKLGLVVSRQVRG